MKYSLTQGGLVVALAGLLVAQLGFSEACTNEVVDKFVPVIGALPGLIAAWIGRFRQGDVTPLGFKTE